MTTKVLAFFFFLNLLRASGESPFGDFVVGVWPEYDHPGVLVIYSGSIKSDHLPLQFEALVPQELDLALAIGQSDTSNKLQPVSVEQRDDGKWVNITFVRERFQLEFYFNPFQEGQLRTADVTVQLNHPLDTYHVAVQHPLGAEKFKLSEPNAETFRDEHGVTYSQLHSASLKAGERKKFSFSYVNRSGKLSVALLQEMLKNTQGMPQSTTDSENRTVVRYRLPTYQPLAVVAVLSVVLGYIFWRSNYSRTGRQLVPAEKNACSHCGAAVAEEDRFCSICGERLA